MPQGLLHYGLYTLSFVRGSPVTETCVKQGSNRGQGPIRFLPHYRGSSPFTHCATSAGTLRHQCQSLRHQCRYTAPPVPVHGATSASTLRHQRRYTAPLVPVHSATSAGTLCHQCRYTAPPVPVHCATSAGTLRPPVPFTVPPVPVHCATSAGTLRHQCRCRKFCEPHRN